MSTGNDLEWSGGQPGPNAGKPPPPPSKSARFSDTEDKDVGAGSGYIGPGATGTDSTSYLEHGHINSNPGYNYWNNPNITNNYHGAPGTDLRIGPFTIRVGNPLAHTRGGGAGPGASTDPGSRSSWLPLMIFGAATAAMALLHRILSRRADMARYDAWARPAEPRYPALLSGDAWARAYCESRPEIRAVLGGGLGRTAVTVDTGGEMLSVSDAAGAASFAELVSLLRSSRGRVAVHCDTLRRLETAAGAIDRDARNLRRVMGPLAEVAQEAAGLAAEAAAASAVFEAELLRRVGRAAALRAVGRFRRDGVTPRMGEVVAGLVATVGMPTEQHVRS
jgi:hypothetical protein